jgi:phospholipid/cholesterol/gamma-HCH transport system substrate-binding protein
MAVKASRVIRVIVIVLFALATSLFLYLLVNNFQFTKGPSVKVHFTSIGDLNNGAWVRKAGLKVGSVTKLEPDVDEKTIIATLVMRPGQIVRTTDKFSLVAKGILGDMYIEQNPGPKESPLAAEGARFEGIPSFNITDLLGGDTMNMITDLAGSLKAVVEVLKANEGALDSTLKDLAAVSRNVRIVTDRAVEITESVPDITNRITSSIETLQATVNDVAVTVESLLAKLEGNLTTTTDDLAVSMRSIREISTEIQGVVTQLTNENSVIAKLGAPATAQSLETTVKNLEAISKGLLSVTRDAEKVVQGISAIFATE